MKPTTLAINDPVLDRVQSTLAAPGDGTGAFQGAIAKQAGGGTGAEIMNALASLMVQPQQSQPPPPPSPQSSSSAGAIIGGVGAGVMALTGIGCALTGGGAGAASKAASGMNAAAGAAAASAAPNIASSGTALAAGIANGAQAAVSKSTL